MTPKTKKIIFLTIGLPIGLGVIIFGIVAVKVAYDSYSWQKKTDTFQAALKKPFEEDNVGGKTPEETWAMFLEALKAKDIDGASKYFFYYDREKQKANFLKGVELGRYDSATKFYVDGPLIKEKENSDNITAYYYIPNPIPKEHIVEAYSIIFRLNEYTKVWKIVSI